MIEAEASKNHRCDFCNRAMYPDRPYLAIGIIYSCWSHKCTAPSRDSTDQIEYFDNERGMRHEIMLQSIGG